MSELSITPPPRGRRPRPKVVTLTDDGVTSETYATVGDRIEHGLDDQWS